MDAKDRAKKRAEIWGSNTPKPKKNKVMAVQEFIAQAIAEEKYEVVSIPIINRQTPYLVDIEHSMNDITESKQISVFSDIIREGLNLDLCTF